MKKRFFLGLSLTLLLINIPGCENSENNNSDNTNMNLLSSETTALPEESNSSEETSVPGKDTTSENKEQENNIADETKQPEETVFDETPEPKTKIAKLSASQQYSDSNRSIGFLGLKEYKKIEDNNYTDKASKGKKYLILFLSIKNDSNEDDYINYNYISAKLDGKKIEHTAIFNQPKNYPTLFSTIKAGKTSAGFIAWEVPSGWKKLEINYDGWKDIDNISLKAEFTPKDLSNPVIYNANNFN